MRRLEGFAPLAAAYDGFIFDLWGVIHDGVQPFAWAIDVLRRLRGRPVVLLSNAPRRAHSAAAMLRGMGIEDALYGEVVTSGEAAHALLRDRAHPWTDKPRLRVLHLGPDRDRNLIEGIGVVAWPDPVGADLLLNTGPDDENPASLESYEALLAGCLAAGVPMLCANPDLEVIRGGVRVLCAGAIAARYRALGGAVLELGKPDPAIYRPVLKRLGVPRARVLAVGDSLRTDIAGAAAAGLASAWVLGGVDSDPTLAAAAGLAPVAWMDRLCW
jgi:HAD superfamily hydrolase (TIGR01459 family)